MHRCEMCNREFKNGAGLAGHNQLKHGFQRSGQPPSMSVPERLSERSESVQEGLLGQILEQQDHILDGLPEGHVHGLECSGCHKLAHQYYEQGKTDGVYEALGTLGVMEAVRYHQQAVRWNQEHPDHLMVENWSELPGVQEILDSSEPMLISIVW